MSLPARFGRYTIERPLGHGGMGTVYLALDDLRHRVVVKVISPDLASDPVAVERLRREALAAAKVSSPHVVRVHEFGVENGTPFIAMEYVEGRSIQQLVTELGRFAPEQATRIVLAAAQGLRDVHAAGILHRDVKPGNILLDGAGQVKLADFGICKLSRKSLEGTPTISLAGEVLGSPDYMAPEQAEGKPLDGRADIYALGVTYYQLLTGQLPFHATTAIATLARALNEKAQPPRAVVPGIPAHVERACLKMMAREPESRPRDAEALIALLEGIGRPSDRTARASERTQRQKAVVAPRPAPGRSPFPVLVAVALVVGGVSGIVAARATPAEPPREATLPAPPPVAPPRAVESAPAPVRLSLATAESPRDAVEPPVESAGASADPAPAVSATGVNAPTAVPPKADVTPVVVVVAPVSNAEALRIFAEEAATVRTEVLAALRARDVDRVTQGARRLRASIPGGDRAAAKLVDGLDTLAASLGSMKAAYAKLKKELAMHAPSEVFQALLENDRKEDELKVGATTLAAVEKIAVPDLLADRERARPLLEWLELALPRVDESWTRAQEELDALDQKPVLERTELAEVHRKYPQTNAGRTADAEWKVVKVVLDTRRRLRDAIRERQLDKAKDLKKPDTRHVPPAFEKEIKDVLAKLAEVYRLVANLAAAMPGEFPGTVEDMQAKLVKTLGRNQSPDTELGAAIVLVAAVDKEPVNGLILGLTATTTAPLLAVLGLDKPDAEAAQKTPKPRNGNGTPGRAK
ncbi:MAG TPA: protein kinase [Planctomycetota bacterium]|nr:protein kinase [Planctomycetota bacterium]